MQPIRFFLALLMLFSTTICLAQDTFATKKEVLTLFKSLTYKIDTMKQELTKQIDSVSSSRSGMSKLPDSSFFNAWKLAKNNPCPLYNYQCEKCKPGPKISEERFGAVVIKIITWILIAVFLFYAIKYFRTTALCRDDSYIINSNNLLELRPEKERPYSYARTQLFWWTMIICTCYSIFFALYGHLLPLTPTCIILLGGGLATQLLGKTIDQSQLQNTVDDTTKDAVPNPVRHQDKNTTKGFLKDILSDDNGISIHRLQSVIFNIIYGIGFIGYFINSMSCCEYPLIEFEGWQLTLLGISAAGYLGMKTTENSRASQEALPPSDKSAVNSSTTSIAASEISPARNQDNYQ
jgi:hypothetical protein